MKAATANKIESTFKSTCKAAPSIFETIFADSDSQVDANVRACTFYLSAEKLIEATVDGLKELGIVKKSLSKRQLRLLALRAQKYAKLLCA